MLVEGIEISDLPECHNQYCLCIVLSVMKGSVVDFALVMMALWWILRYFSDSLIVSENRINC